MKTFYISSCADELKEIKTSMYNLESSVFDMLDYIKYEFPNDDVNSYIFGIKYYYNSLEIDFCIYLLEKLDSIIFKIEYGDYL